MWLQDNFLTRLASIIKSDKMLSYVYKRIVDIECLLFTDLYCYSNIIFILFETFFIVVE